ncbi:MAG TPA: response regulator [Tahibacter sp.]|nr:response regulator [Tahibacter sp.]
METGAPARVTIVDDDPVLADLLVRYIGVLGFPASRVDPHDAERIATSIVASDASVVLLDIDLGDTSGFDVVRFLRKLGYVGMIVAMTGLAFHEKVGQGRLREFNGYWRKPVDPDQIKEFLHAVS